MAKRKFKITASEQNETLDLIKNYIQDFYNTNYGGTADFHDLKSVPIAVAYEGHSDKALGQVALDLVDCKIVYEENDKVKNIIHKFKNLTEMWDKIREFDFDDYQKMLVYDSTDIKSAKVANKMKKDIRSSVKKFTCKPILASAIDKIAKLPEQGKVISKTVNGWPVVVVGLGNGKYMYKEYMRPVDSKGDVQFIRGLIKRGDSPEKAVENLGYKSYERSGDVDSACGGKKPVKSAARKPARKTVKASTEYLESELADKTKYKLIKDAYNENNLTIVKHGDSFYFERTPSEKVANLAIKEIKRIYPELTYIGDIKASLKSSKRSRSVKAAKKDNMNKEAHKWYNISLTKEEYAKFRKFLKENGYEYEPSEEGQNTYVKVYLTKADADKVNKFLDSMDDVESACGGKKSKKTVKASAAAKRRAKQRVACSEDGPLCVCEHCLWDIESREGRQVIYDEFESEVDYGEPPLICDWCEEEVEKLYQITPGERIESAEQPVKADDEITWNPNDDIWNAPLEKYSMREVIDAMDILGYHYAKPTYDVAGPIKFTGYRQVHGLSTFRNWHEVEEFIDDALRYGVSESDGYSPDAVQYIPELLEQVLVDGEKWDGYRDDIDASAKAVKCSRSDNYNDLDEHMQFRVCTYFDDNFRDLEDCAVFDNLDEAIDYAHESLGKGPTSIEDYFTGKLEINPDEYWDNFDGEFECTSEIADWVQNVRSDRMDHYVEPWLEDWQYNTDIGMSVKGDRFGKTVTAADSLNMKAGAGHSAEWVLRGCSSTGEDITTDRIGFQEDVKQAVSDMFAYPEVDTIDLYKVDYEYDTTGTFEDEELFTVFTRSDFERTGRAIPQYDMDYMDYADDTSEIIDPDDYAESEFDKAINAALNNESRTDYISNPIYELDKYLKDLAEGVVYKLPKLTYEISDEAITFSDAEGNVVYVQPVSDIVPEPDDLEHDMEELAEAVVRDGLEQAEREEFDRAWDATYDPDTAMRKIEFAVGDDDLDYITGDDEDLGYGFNSNGEALDESTVDELCRIANEILDSSELAQYDRYTHVDRDSFEYYGSIPYIQEEFYICFELRGDGKWFLDNGFVDFGGELKGWNVSKDYAFKCDIYIKNGEVIDIIYDETPAAPYGADYNYEAIARYIKELAAPVAMEIYNGTTNI
ncbi:hypothetical protein [Ruminococcus sp.]|uniref:hypothetical protein n=1 Tax=Ruminococcus sp. TaxID=41978 RepID=UPI001B67E9BB|nr:hypothetical protein [Ruminococcus sp.]MBP5433691.1 hypothetical protein [Ruminococcus sp.]